MKRALVFLAVLCGVAVLSGCASVGGMPCGVLEIPESRDMASLEKTPLCEAEQAVATAHRVGAQHYSAYEYFSAAQYLDMACEEKAEGDWRGSKDYTILAKKWADAAISEGSGIADKGAPGMPKDEETCRAEWERLKGRFRELCPSKAKLVAPVLYAHVEATLSCAEHELAEARDYPEAARKMVTIEPDIDTIWSQDVDKDGIVDMKDGDPWAPEDKDNYEDNDGIPEPKPYPVLDAIHFASGKADLSAEAKGYLRGVAQMLVDGYSEATLCVDGHTDEIASEKYNIDLSERRAMAVQECLIAAGAKPGQLKVAWHGESQPCADNSTAAGKAKNRRVELKLDSPDVVTQYCKCAKCTTYK